MVSRWVIGNDAHEEQRGASNIRIREAHVDLSSFFLYEEVDEMPENERNGIVVLTVTLPSGAAKALDSLVYLSRASGFWAVLS
jgi:hypothetical protein